MLCITLKVNHLKKTLQQLGFPGGANGKEPVSSALAGGFFTTEPLGKPSFLQ